MTTIEAVTAKLEIGRILELLSLDLTSVGAGEFNCYSGFDETSELPNATIEFDNRIFAPVPFVSTGWAVDGTGAMPRPEITIADFDGVLLAEVQQNDDLIGIPVKRWETTYDLLETGSAYGPEIYIINQVLESDGFTIKFALASVLDQRQKKLPFRCMYKTSFPALARTRVSR